MKFLLVLVFGVSCCFAESPFNSLYRSRVNYELLCSPNLCKNMSTSDLFSCQLKGYCVPESSLRKEKTQVSGARQIDTDTQKCDICMYAMDMAIEKLNGNRNTTDVQKVVSNVCFNEVLTKQVISDCLKIVHEKFDKMVELLTKGETYEEICFTTGHCEFLIDEVENEGNGEVNRQDYVNEDEEPIESSTDQIMISECSKCQSVIEHFADNTKSLPPDTTATLLIYLCRGSTAPDRSFCEELLKKEGASRITELLISRTPPAGVCAKLGFCEESTGTRAEVPQTEEDFDCSFLLLHLINTLKANEMGIMQWVKSTCSYTPKSFAPGCQDLLKDTIQHLENLNVTTVCAEVKEKMKKSSSLSSHWLLNYLAN